MSEHRISLHHEARALPMEERKEILLGIRETEMHGYLASLFRAMDRAYLVEVTHGAHELGKDLVVFRDDPLSPDVIAIVVKRGDVKAKTAGDVDEIRDAVDVLLQAKGERVTSEIRSQVRQAQAHPAELKAVFARLKVTKVIVVLVGEISSGVRTRFEAEIGATAAVKDLLWLTNAFTEHYPQIFFDAAVTDFLDTMVQALEKDSFYAQSKRTLSECFVEPVVQPDQHVSFDRNSLKVRFHAKPIQFGKLMSLIERKRRVLLVGDPGSGKSKAAAKLCIDAYRHILAQSAKREDQQELQRIPLLITARELESVHSTDALNERLLPAEVRQRFGVGLLIVDGLDEVVAAKRQTVLDRATAFSNDVGCFLLVTARNIAPFATAPVGFSRCVLLPFQVGQALRLVDKVLTSVDVLPALKKGIQQIRTQLPMSPLSLLLLIDLVRERKEVPSSITELYDRFLDLVFGRWDRDKGVDILFEYVVKKRFLASFAFKEFFKKGRLDVPLSDFNKFVAEYATEYGWDDTKLHGFVKEIERAGILTIQEDCFFRHRSFLDYFVAFYVHERRDTFANLTDDLLKIYYDQLWSDVAFFFVGLSREVPPELMERIFANPEDRPVEKVLAGRLLQAGWHSPRRVKEQGVRQALSFAPASADAATQFAEALYGEGKKAPRLFGDTFAAVVAERSLGSTFLSQELEQVATELEKEQLNDRSAALKRISVLWALRNISEPAGLAGRVKRFVADVQTAQLPAAEETELLLLAGATNENSAEIHKAITRRLKRIIQLDPTTIRAVLPGYKVKYRPPRQK